MPDSRLPVSPATLTRFGLREPETAAQEIAELAEAIFGPFDPEVAEVWNAAAERKRDHADQSALLFDAAAASDPLLFLADFPDACAMLHRRMRSRWFSSLRARALGHPPDLKGQTWSSLSEAARDEVRQALRELSGFERQHVRRGTPQRARLDTFLRELAVIYARYTDYPDHEMGLSSHIGGDFIGLAQTILAGLPRLENGKPRVHLTEQTAGALSNRWQSIRKHDRTGSDL
jgi:hypothetical protein